MVRSDVVFFETPSGGAVFSAGSISWCASLPGNGFDNSVSHITKNVLQRFADPKPFPLAGLTGVDVTAAHVSSVSAPGRPCGSGERTLGLR